MIETFSNIAALQAYSDSATLAIVRGHVADRDGRIAVYARDDTDTVTPSDGNTVVIDSASPTPRHWKKILNFSERQFTPLFPQVSVTNDYDSVIPYPSISFGEGWPDGVVPTMANNIYMYNADASINIGIEGRDEYGTAITRVARVDGFNSILNVGPTNSANQPGGASLQTAIFIRTDAYEATTAGVRLDYEWYNPIESHGLWTKPNAGWRGKLPPHLIGVNNTLRQIHVTGKMQLWFNPKYKPTAANARAAGATNDYLSDTEISKTYSMGYIGLNPSDKPVLNVVATDVAIRKMTQANIANIDILSGYHFNDAMPKFYEYDPRTPATAPFEVYPYRIDALTIRACANYVTGTYSSVFASGHVVDGYTLQTGDIIIVLNRTTASENGLKIVTSSTPTDYTATTPKQVHVTVGSIWNGTFWDRQSANLFTRGRNYGRLPQITASADGSRAFGIYTPQIPLRNEDNPSDTGETPDDTFSGVGYYSRTSYNNEDPLSPYYSNTNGWEVVILGGVLSPEPRRFKMYYFYDTLANVKAGIDAVHAYTKVLKPTVFDWKYYRDNTRGLETTTEDQVRLHWLCRGAAQGSIAKSGFTYPSGTTNFFDYLRNF